MLRRGVHVGLVLVPVVYYFFGERLAAALGLPLPALVGLVAVGLTLAEIARLALGTTVFGQRRYEARRISAFTWGGLAISAVLLLAPRHGGAHPAHLGLPLVWSLALGDPVLGEARRAGWPPWLALLAGGAAVGACWIVGVLWLGTPPWAAALLAPIQLLAERPRLASIDDNATMLLLPLVAALVISPWL